MNMRVQWETQKYTTQISLQTFPSNKLYISNCKAASLRECDLLQRTDLMISEAKVKPKLHGDSNTSAEYDLCRFQRGCGWVTLKVILVSHEKSKLVI